MKKAKHCLFIAIFIMLLRMGVAEAQTLIAEYEFENTLTDRLAGSTLTAWGASPVDNRNNIESGFSDDSAGTYWYWKSNQTNGGGFYIDINQDIRTNYSIGLRFRFNETGPGYRKIIDYQDQASDNGFYFYGGKLNFYPVGTGTTSISNNQYIDLVATRASDGTFKAYFVVNGSVVSPPELNVNAGTNGYPVLVGGKPRFGFFFNDDYYAGEATTGGKVYGIKVWDGAFTTVEQIQAAMNPKATIANVSIIGATGTAITPTNVVVTLLQSITISTSIAQNTDLSSWITNLPAGLTARAKTAINAGATSFTLEVTGTPSVVLSSQIRLTVPAAYVSPSANVYVAQNPNATFGIAPYNVTYDGNANTGGSVPIDGNNYAAGGSVTVLSNSGSLTKTGYTFQGWNTKSDGSGTSYAVGSSFTMSTYNVTLYARWTLSATPPPTVTTQAVTNTAQTTATGNGNITNLGSPNPTAHGVCYGTNPNPSINNASYTNRGAASSTGAFTSNLSGLTPGTTYYVRAYATNTGGTSYGEQVSFSTVAISCTFTGGSLYTAPTGIPGSTNQPFGRFQLSAASSGASLTAVTIKLNGTRSGASNFKLWHSTDSEFNPAGDTQLGSTVTSDPGSGNSVTFSSLSRSISTGGTYFFNSYDLAGNATGSIIGVVENNNSITLSAGAISGTINNDNLSSGNTLLPVELTSFTPYVSGRDVILSWQSASEVNTSLFAVERSRDNENWRRIGAVDASGYSNAPREYSFTDKTLHSGKYYYRLKMIDTDGSFEYSPVIEANVEVPAHYTLSQNYPNPFNPATTITFGLPEKTHLSIVVYNQLGEITERLISGEYDAGYHHYVWNASNHASGFYFCELRTAGFRSVRKMILTK